jgi:ribonucleoside-diphosphate reductase alpha chain
VPLWHDSEVAAIAYALQNLIAGRNGQAAEAPAALASAPAATAPMAGAKCPECGAYAMIRKDGCDYCTQCGHLGACG